MPNPPDQYVHLPQAPDQPTDAQRNLLLPKGLFEALQGAHHDPEEYNRLLARIIAGLSVFIAGSEIVWRDGIPYILDPARHKTISVYRLAVQAGYYGLNQNSRYMRVSEVASAGDQGFFIPKPATVTGLWGKSRSNGAWQIQVKRNGNPIALGDVQVNNGSGSNMFLDVDLNAGDWLQFYLSGSGVDHPTVACELAWRLPQ